MPDKFENATLLLWIWLPSTLIRIKRSMKTELFENALQSGTIWKRYFFVLVWTRTFSIRNFSNTLMSFCHVIYLPKYSTWQRIWYFEILKVNNHLKRSSVDAEHLFRFRSQSCVFKFIRHSVDEASVSSQTWVHETSLSQILWIYTFNHLINFLCYEITAVYVVWQYIDFKILLDFRLRMEKT